MAHRHRVALLTVQWSEFGSEKRGY